MRNDMKRYSKYILKSRKTRYMLYSNCVYPPKIHILKSKPPKVMELVSRAFRKDLCYEGKTLMNGINVFIKKALERSPALSTM